MMVCPELERQRGEERVGGEGEEGVERGGGGGEGREAGKREGGRGEGIRGGGGGGNGGKGVEPGVRGRGGFDAEGRMWVEGFPTHENSH